MEDGVVDVLSWIVFDSLIWVSIGLFLLGMVFKDRARVLSAAGWVVFGFHWLLQFPHFYTETHSAIKSVLTLLALPGGVYVAYLVLTKSDETDVLIRISQAVAAMGLIYLPFATYEPLSNALIEHTAKQEYRALQLLGVDAQLTERDDLMREFVVTNPTSGETHVTYIILACTGLGSMAIFGGLIAAIKAPLDRKLKAFAVSIPVIYVLNLIRNVFITTAYGHQWFQIGEETLSGVLGKSESYVSFFLADKVIAQSLSIVALIGITLAVIKVMPELMDMIQEVLDLLGLSKSKKDGSKSKKEEGAKA